MPHHRTAAVAAKGTEAVAVAVARAADTEEVKKVSMKDLAVDEGVARKVSKAVVRVDKAGLEVAIKEAAGAKVADMGVDEGADEVADEGADEEVIAKRVVLVVDMTKDSEGVKEETIKVEAIKEDLVEDLIVEATKVMDISDKF